MRQLRVFVYRIVGIFGKSRRDRELADEIESNLQLHIADNVRAGMTPEEARRQAMIKLGGVEQAKESYRERHGLPLIETLLQDARYAVRCLRKSPAFTATAVMTVALGIGANTAIFSAAEGIWLRPLPFTDTSRMLVLGEQTARSDSSSVAAATYREWRAHSRSFSAISAYEFKMVNLARAIVPERVQAVEVDEGFFDMLGMHTRLGRTFSPDEFQPGQNVAVLSYSLWQAQFGGRSDVVGTTFLIDGRPTTIVGVMNRANDFPAATALWVPLAYTPTEWANTKALRVRPLARLRDGISQAQAAAELDLLMRSVSSKSPRDYEGLRSALFPLDDVINGTMTPGFLRVLLGAAGFVLLIACINLGNLQLARATARQKEFSLRAALGCSRGRLSRQVLTESMVLALAGAAAGLLIAYGAVRVMVTSMPPETARQIAGWTEMRIDGRALLFTIAAAIASGLVAALIPMMRGFRFAPGEALKAGTTSRQSAPHRLRGLLVVGETAFALMLLVGTVLVVQGLHHILASAAEFAPTSLLTAEVTLDSRAYATPANQARFYSQALEGLRTLPGVTATATFSSPPFSNNGVNWKTFRTSMMPGTSRLPGAILQSVSPGYFAALRIPLLSGRDLAGSDGPDTLPVAIVSDVMARKYWPGQSPVGQRVYLRESEKETALTIVGVAAGVVYDWTDNAPEAVIYLPFLQRPQREAIVAVRSNMDTAALAPEVRAAIARIDPDLPLTNVKPLDRRLIESMAGLAQIDGLMSSFGIIALLLAAAGIYGLVSYTVTQRTPEVGIRMALGARRRDVLHMILSQMLRLALLGIVLGLAGAIALGRIVRGFFFGATAGSPAPFVAALLMLVLAAVVASFGPARRATKVDPLVALRYE